MKQKTKRFYPDPGRNRPKINNLFSKMKIRTLPRTARGGGDKNNIKSVLKYNWDWRDLPTKAAGVSRLDFDKAEI